MNVAAFPQGGFALALAAALLLLVLPLGLARIAGADQGRPWREALREMLVCAGCGALAFYLVGVWLLFGPDALGLFGLPPSAAMAAGLIEPPGLSEPAFFLYHLGLCLAVFWLFYAANGARLTLAGNALICVVICVFVFPVIGHMSFGQRWLGPAGAGFLGLRGYSDPAGAVACLGCAAFACLAGLLDAPAPQQDTPPRDDPGAFRLVLFAWLTASALAGQACGLNFFASLVKLVLAGVFAALAASTTCLAWREGTLAAWLWLRLLVLPDNRALLPWLANPGPVETIGLAAGIAAISSGLALSPWWAPTFIAALAGSLAWLAQDFLGEMLELSLPARRTRALGLGAGIGACASGLVGLPLPALLERGMFVASGATLAGIELTGAATTAAWSMAVVWLAQRGLRRAERALALLPSPPQE